MTGDLPPSSSVMRVMLSMQAWPMSLPTSVEPVKLTLLTSGCETRGAPVPGPSPVTTLNTPGGKPASWISSASISAVSGVCSAGLSTRVQPAASAGASFQVAMSRGKFQGTTAATTPTGSRRV